MRPVSDAFLRTVSGSHRMCVEARICDPGQTGVDPAGTEIRILDGDVRLDATADVRSTVDLTTDGNRAWDPHGLLNPYGPEVWIRRGVELGVGREWVSLGYHKVYAVDQDNTPDGPIRITARDRMSGLVDADMLAPRQFKRTQSVRQMVESLVLEVYPTASIAYDFDPDAAKLNRTILVEERRYEALRDLARSLGKILYYDHAGILQLRDAPAPLTPVLEVAPGRGGVLVSMSRSLSREGVYNAVVAVGEAGDSKAPARAVARDMNPASPTYWNGPYGKVPRLYSSPLITSNAQAGQAATALLRSVVGFPHAVDFSAVPNPALEPLDQVRVRYRDGSVIHAVTTLTVPLTAEQAMTATTLDQTGLTIEVGDE